MPNNLFIVAAAALVALFLTPLARRLALRLRVLDHPEPRKIHRSPIPRLGGLAIYVAFIVTVPVFAGEHGLSGGLVWNQLLAVLGGATFIVMVGIMDDGGWLRPLAKLVIGMPLAGALVAAGGIRVTTLPMSYLGADSPAFHLASWILTILWFMAVISAVIILDHMDGLCAGVVGIAAAFFLLLALLEGQLLVAPLAAAVLGASLGFWVWNRQPARIFMGEGGALFFGFMMATLGIKLRFPSLPAVQSWVIPILVLGVPLFDAALVTVSRLRRGLDPLRTPGRDHTAHRLTRLGLDERRAVRVLHASGILLGLAACSVLCLGVAGTYVLVAAVALGGCAAIAWLERRAC